MSESHTRLPASPGRETNRELTASMTSTALEWKDLPAMSSAMSWGAIEG